MEDLDLEGVVEKYADDQQASSADIVAGGGFPEACSIASQSSGGSLALAF